MSRPSDHIDAPTHGRDEAVVQPRLGPVGYLRFFWRQLTSMRTALFLLLLLAIAAVPGSLVPQRTSDPNGVVQYLEARPTLGPILDSLQAFDVYSSVWFSSIYLLLFVSLIGCVIPRAVHHAKALRSQPPKTPARLERLDVFSSTDVSSSTDVPLRRADTDAPAPASSPITVVSAIESARTVLRRSGYRVRLYDGPGEVLSVSAERGYLRETGNLVFHTALIGVLVSVGIGGGFGYSGQRVLVEGDSFANVLLSYESFLPGRFFDEQTLQPYRLTLDDFDVEYEAENRAAIGQPLDYDAHVTAYLPDENGELGAGVERTVKVNDPLRIGGNDVYLLGNGYAPVITVRDGEGNVAYSQAVPFLPQPGNTLTSLGVVKVPDALPEQIGMIGFFYPTAVQLQTGAFTSNYPDLLNPVLSLQVFTGDLRLDDGVYALDTADLTEIAGRTAATPSIQLRPGETVDLPGGVGSVTFENADPTPSANDLADSVPRFVSFDIHSDPSQGWVLLFALLVLAGLLTSLFIPRRRVWVKAVPTGTGLRLEYAGLARGDDPGLERAVGEVQKRHSQQIGLGSTP